MVAANLACGEQNASRPWPEGNVRLTATEASKLLIAPLSNWASSTCSPSPSPRASPPRPLSDCAKTPTSIATSGAIRARTSTRPRVPVPPTSRGRSNRSPRGGGRDSKAARLVGGAAGGAVAASCFRVRSYAYRENKRRLAGPGLVESTGSSESRKRVVSRTVPTRESAFFMASAEKGAAGGGFRSAEVVLMSAKSLVRQLQDATPVVSPPSLLACDFAELRRGDSPRRRGRGARCCTWTSWTATSCPT